MRHVAVLSLSAVLAACASQPSPDMPAASPSPAASVPAPPVSVQGEQGVAKVAAAAPGQPVKAPPGYKLARRNGELLYCQTAKQVGSNLPKQVCVTPEAYENMERSMEQDRENFRRNGALCGTGGCGGS